MNRNKIIALLKQTAKLTAGLSGAHSRFLTKSQTDLIEGGKKISAQKEFLEKENVNVNVNADKSQNEKTSISSLPFVGLGFLGRKLYIILPVFILSMKYIILPIFKDNFPLIYENILHILSVVTPYIPITLLSWVLLLTFYYLIELYLYLIICSRNENLKIPAYMPKIIQTQVNNLYEESQSNLKQEMTKYYTKNCITHIILSIISVLLYIIFIPVLLGLTHWKMLTSKNGIISFSNKKVELHWDKNNLLNKTQSFNDRSEDLLNSIKMAQKAYEETKDPYQLGQIQRHIETYVKESDAFNVELTRLNNDMISEAESTVNYTNESSSELPTDLESQGPSESNLLGTIQDMIDQVNQMLSGLTLEQHACFVNTMALLSILTAMNAIVAIFYGDKLIKYFDLENRYPKLKKWIEYRRTFQNYFFIYNLIFIYVVIFLTVSVNIFMFFM